MFAGAAAFALGLAVAPVELPEPAPAAVEAVPSEATPVVEPMTSEAEMLDDAGPTAPRIPSPRPRTPANSVASGDTPGPAAPHSRGIPLFVLGGAATTIGVALNVFVTADSLREADGWDAYEEARCEDDDNCTSPATGYILLNLAPSVAFATGFGMIAGGMARLGRLDAWADVVGGRRATPWRPRPRLGWGLFGAGLGLWAVTRLAGAACGARSSETCAIAVWEAGYVGSLAMTGPGLAMIGYAAGHRRQRRALATLRVQPMIAGELVGLTVGGRF